MKKFGMMKKYDDSERFLTEHPHLTCEETANYLVLWCIDLACEQVRIPCTPKFSAVKLFLGFCSGMSILTTWLFLRCLTMIYNEL